MSYSFKIREFLLSGALIGASHILPGSFNYHFPWILQLSKRTQASHLALCPLLWCAESSMRPFAQLSSPDSYLIKGDYWLSLSCSFLQQQLSHTCFLALREGLMLLPPCKHREVYTYSQSHIWLEVWEPDSFLIDLWIMQSLIICGLAFDVRSSCPIWKKGLVPTYL